VRCSDQDPPSAPDLATVEVLCRLQAAARRVGCDIRVHQPSAALRDLIHFAGLSDSLLLPADAPMPPRSEIGGSP